MSDFDQLHRFLIDRAHVRGQLVRLQDSLKDIVHSQEYPVQIQRLLSEMAAVTSMLTAILKFEGEISLQIQSNGPVNYAVINATHEQTMRGVARWDQSLTSLPDELEAMLSQAVLVITITPEEGERYQGVVALDKPTLGECVESYFAQSEQLPTKIMLMTDMHDPQNIRAAGMLLQVLPQDSSQSVMALNNEFEHLVKLGETLSEEEMFNLSVSDILYRLYHQEKVELFSPQPVKFACTCSKERSAQALLNVEKSELLDIVAEDGAVSMNCQYCHAEYKFDAIDIEAIHAGNFESSAARQ
ncbi:Hsp33 family molecular chaperone HslO [Alteromonas sp. ASW11-130]|uniref:Hsp33 family molecular chaperone HslO n=1 Tax=Alteromonas sp. ASW11-130 TaxID=3015775 RepID=UPI002241F8EF|nr:Hsp33 family molecular chaperone HslO [Alteromonas sp. ASW11-130]MCW8093265.1 Hsp33 family molecular chaperone HslO [Alteromonas sp. ASW11-130]